MRVARMLAEAGLLDPSPNAPAPPRTMAEVSPPPAAALTVAAIADRINTWGRAAVDPTVPALDTPCVDERSVRYSLKALDEAVMSGRKILDEDYRVWSWVHTALQDAQLTAGYTIHAVDEGDRNLKWYIALLHLERARTVWAEHIGQPLAPSAA